MTGYLRERSGNMRPGIPYEIQDEGYDYYLFSNGQYVEKSLVEFGGREKEQDDYYSSYYEMSEEF